MSANADFVYSWSRDVIPQQISDAASSLRRLGFTGLDRAGSLQTAAQKLRTDFEQIQHNAELSQAGKEKQLAVLVDRREEIKQGIASLKASLTAQAAALTDDATYTQASPSALLVIQQALATGAITPQTVDALWSAGDEYKDFVVNHLIPYAKLVMNGSDIPGLERYIEKLTGAAERQSLITSLINALSGLIAYTL